MALTSGTKLGPYEIIAPLGAGGMGEVYRARDTRLERTVAIKILPAHLSDDAMRRQRFEREAKAVSSLNHPHICTLYDIGRQDGVDFIVMEYVAQRWRHVWKRGHCQRRRCWNTAFRLPAPSTKRTAVASRIGILSPETLC
jgi:hypothetical protein